MPSVVKLKNLKVMTYPGPLSCSQKLSRLDSRPQSEQHPKHLAKDAWERIGFRSQVLGTVILSVMLYPIIGDTAARKTNRMIMRPPPQQANGEPHSHSTALKAHHRTRIRNQRRG